jgi:integrase
LCIITPIALICQIPRKKFGQIVRKVTFSAVTLRIIWRLLFHFIWRIMRGTKEAEQDERLARGTRFASFRLTRPAQRLIEDYLALTGHRTDMQGALFRPVKNNRTGRLDRHLDPASVYRNIVRKYGLETGISAEVNGLCVHSLRATAATNALSHDSDIAKVQEWLGHANVSTTRLMTGARVSRKTVRAFG